MMTKEERKAYNKEYYAKNRDKRQAQIKEYNTKNKDKLIVYRKEHYQNNKEKSSAYQREYLRQNRHKRNEYYRNRYKTDPLYALDCKIRDRFRKEGEKKHKTGDISNLTGCSLEQLRSHLQAQFKNGMTWENQGEWHIDHIIPLAAGKTYEEKVMLSHFSNLQPMWGPENLSKGDTLPDTFPPNFPYWQHFIHLFEENSL